MRIVAWNVHRAGSKVSDFLDELEPDVAILSEWARLPSEGPTGASSFLEFGLTGKFGLGVAAWGEWTVSHGPVEPHNDGIVGPVSVDGPVAFNLVAAWAALSSNPEVNPIAGAVDEWSDWLATAPCVVAGDFNTGGWWKKLTEGPKSHYPLVEHLGQLGLRSAYHADRGTEQGVDEDPTHWNNNGGSYMIDHVFTPIDWPIRSVTVGKEDPWRARSDHAPVIVDLDIG